MSESDSPIFDGIARLLHLFEPEPEGQEQPPEPEGYGKSSG